LLIDTCASGGRRNDLETLRRSVPLWRSDYAWEPIGQQCQTYGLSFWVPYYGTGVTSDDPYVLRSDMAPFFLMSWDMRKTNLDYPRLRRLVQQWRKFAAYYLSDYYPLTHYSPESTVWIAWQFDCPERGEGMVQAFRRNESVYEVARLKLHGLEPTAVYTLTNLDVPGTTEMTGRELAEPGLPIAIKDRPDSAVIVYKKKP
jgi:alpha-galactosidase